MSELPRVSLLALDRDAGEVELLGEDGKAKWVTVKPIDGPGYQVLLEVQRAREEKRVPDINALYEAAFRCIRSGVTMNEIQKLNMVQLGAILTVASNSVEDVKKYAEGLAAKNGNGATAKTPAPQRKTASTRTTR
jgi:hypothetical protein